MDSKKRLALNLLMAIMSVSTVAGVVACDENGDPTDYGEKGSYYFVDANGEEYVITLNGNSFVLVMDDQTELGTYTYDGATLTMTYGDGASLQDDVLTLVSGENTYQFLRKVNYTVTFDVDGGSDVTAKTVMNGKTLAKPADPTKEGYEFVGWYTDADYTTSFVFDATPIKENLTLYAKYAKESAKEYAVKLVVDGETLERKETIGAVAQDLPTPKKEGATFVGWWKSDYEDASRLTAQYKGGTLTEDTTLYAVWKNDAPAVSVTATGATWTSLGETDSYTVTIKTASGAKVEGPVTSNATTFEYDFSKCVAGDYIVEVSCKGKVSYGYYQNKALDRVSNMYVSGSDTLIYGAVENAEKYIITITCGNGDHVHKQIDNGTSTYYNFANCEMQEGGITFSVQAVAKGYATSVSETLTFERKLDAVTGVAYDNATGLVSWNEVKNATNYAVTVTKGDDVKTYAVNGTSFSLKNYAGDVTVKVTAKASGYVANSATIEATLAKYSAPTNVRIEMANLTPYLVWDEMAGVDVKEYIVYVGSNVYTTTEARYEWPATATMVGTEYKVKVQAIGADDEESFATDEIKMVYKAMGEVNYKAGKVSWTPVVGARSYVVKVNGVTVTPKNYTGTSFDVTFTKEGVNDISVTYYDEWNSASGSAFTEVSAYKIDLMVQGGKAIDSVYRAVGDPLNLAETTKQGYNFTGWYNVPGGASVNGALYADEYFYGGKNLTLYASWQAKRYDVVLKLDQNSDEVFSTEDLYYEQSFELTVPESPDPSKVFAGWVNSTNGSQVTGADGKSTITWPTDGGATFYASWVQILNFTKNEAGTAYTVTAGQGVQYAKEITIPATYQKDGDAQPLPVTTIASGTFAGCTALKTVNIPDTVTNIAIGTGGPTAAASAFKNCDGLENLNIYCTDEANGQTCTHTDKVYSSEDGVLFYHGAGYTEIYYYPQGRTGDYEIPEGVTVIPTSTFKKAKLGKVTAPASLTVVEADAFNGSTMTEIVFQSGGAELTLANNSLANCGALESITLPDTFNAWTTNIIKSSANIKNVFIDGANGYYKSRNGVLCDTLGDTILYFPTGRDGSYAIPAQVSKIADNAFKGSSRLQEVIIHEYVSEIGVSAFEDCSKLRTISFRTSDESDLELIIKEKAFHGCTAASSVKLPSHLKELQVNAFGKTYALRTVELNAKADAVLAEGAFQTVPTMNGSVVTREGECYVQNIVIGKDFNAVANVASLFKGGKIYKVEADDNNAQYSDLDNVLFSKDMSTIVFYPYGESDNYTIPDTVTTINAYVFQGRTNLTDLVIPASVTTIGAYAFEGSTISSLTFSDRTAELEIGEQAFANCIFLNGTVDVKENVTVLGSKVFAGCTKLDEVKLPSTLIKMGKYSNDELVEVDCFEGCTELNTINVASNNQVFASDNGVLFDVSKETLYLAPFGFSGDANKAYEINANVKTITARAFYMNGALKTLSFADPDAEVTIGEKAFAGMTALETFVVPNNMTNISDEMFKGCTALKTFYVPATVTYIGTRAFDGCTTLTTVTFDQNRNGLALTMGAYTSATQNTLAGNYKDGGYQFFNCTSLTGIELPEGTDIIPGYAFQQCYKLASVTIPSTVTKIGSSAFGDGSKKDIVAGKDGAGISLTFSANDPAKNLTSRLTEIASSAFRYTKVTGELKLPDSITTLGGFTFAETLITKLTVPAGLTKSGGQEFATCANLSEVVLSQGLKKIFTTMFMSCTALTEIEIPNSVEIIEQSAFNKSGLMSIDIPDTVTAIGTSTFGQCNSLEEVTVGAGVRWINIAANGRESAAQQIFSQCAALEKATIYTETLTKAMFEKCEALKEIYLPNATEIPDCLTKNPYPANNNNPSPNIEKIVLSDEVTSIGQKAFYGATALKTIQYVEKTTALTETTEYTNGFPDSLTTIAASAFEGCGMTSLTLSEHITSLGERAFYGCNELVSLTVNAKIALPKSVFMSCSKLGLQDAENGINGTVTLCEGITSIGAYAFSTCSALTTITIPSSVTSIGEYAFSSATKLANVTFTNTTENPAKISSIANNAFGNTALTKFELPLTNVSTLTLGESMFKDCGSLTEVKLSPNVQSVTDVFNGIKCTPMITLYTGDDVVNQLNIQNSLILSADGKTLLHVYATESNISQEGKFQVPDGIETIAKNAFASCTWMEEVIIPASVTKLADSAFYGLTSLEKVTFLTKEGQQDYGITEIGEKAFYGAGLTELYLPASVQVVGKNAFTLCASLTTVVIDGNYLGESMFSTCKALTSVTLNGEPAELKTETFWACTALTTITLPDSIQTFGNSVFKGCTALTSIAFPARLSAMGTDVFNGCTALVTVTMKGTITSIPKNTFTGCSKLATVKLADSADTVKFALPATVTTIGDTAFKGCVKLTEINLPSNIQSIGVSAFEGCTQVTKVDLGGENSSLTSIGETAFKGLTNRNFKTLYIPSLVTTIGKEAFMGCSNLTTLTIDGNLTTLGEGAFMNCSINALDLSNTSLTVISKAAFAQTKIAELTLPTTLTEMKDFAFLGIQITELDLSAFSALTNIRDLAFANATKLKTVMLPSMVSKLGGQSGAKMGDFVQNFPFSGCTALESITIDASNPYFFSKDGIVYDSAKNRLMWVPQQSAADNGLLFIDGGVEIVTIGWYYMGTKNTVYASAPFTQSKDYSVLGGNTKIKGVSLPAGMTAIPENFFTDSAVETVEIPNSVTEIGEKAFVGVESLEKVYLPKNLLTIGDNAFNGCTNLKSIDLPDGLETIGAKAFYNTGLTKVTIPESVKTIGKVVEATDDDDNGGSSSGGPSDQLRPMSTGTGAVSSGAKAGMSDLGGFTPMPGGPGTFPGGGGTTEEDPYEIKETISEAFANCVNLEEVIFEGAPTMYGGTFKGCTSLKKVTLANGTKELEAEMFSGCTALTQITIPASVEKIGKDAFKDWTSAQTIVLKITQAQATTLGFTGKFGSATVVYADAE